jgi:hypothetical protein
MNQTFDFFGAPEQPYIILCNPNKSELYSLGLAYQTNIIKRFNALSEFSFTFPKSIDSGETIIDAYSYLNNKRLILVEGEGYFQITNVEENFDGSIPVKSIECLSLENELVQKRLVSYSGTKPLYNVISPNGSILQDMVNLCPTWSVGTVDPELLTIYRTFEIRDSNIYEFLMGDCSKAFECIFKFDTVLKTISAYALQTATIETDIFMSFDNIIKSANFSEKSDEICTCLEVKGGGDLSIAAVNPLGTSKIYDFSYYANTSWMTQGLVDALTAWDAIVDSNQYAYSDLLLLLQTHNAELLVLQSDLDDLNSEYLTLEGIQKARIEKGITYSDITAQMTAKQAEIDGQESLIDNKQSQITETTNSLQSINTTVGFSSNFSETQLLELQNFIFENSYLNSNIIQTDSMTAVEIQDAQQFLYDQAQNVLSRVSQPRYEISLESVNYIALQDFSSTFTQQTELGCVVTAEINEGVFIETVLLELSYGLDDPTEFEMTFSNRLRLDNAGYTYSDLLGEIKKTGSAVSFDDYKWANWDENYKDDVSGFITSALDTTTNNLISNSNQEILINQNGLRGRTYDPITQTFEDTQVWLTSSVLAFSDDAFQTSKLALGKITIDGQNYFGLIGDYLVGRIIAGNSLTISNEANNFTLNASGATLSNATFNITNTNSRIFLDPTNGMKIQQNVGGTWTDRFSVDGTGNVNFSGNLSGASGTFSGTIAASVGNIGTLVIDSLGLKTADGTNYLRGDGSLKWGGLSITAAGNATFTGNIYADKLIGSVSYSQLTDIPAEKITSGTMSGNRVYGGSPTFNSITTTSGTLIVNGSLNVTAQTLLHSTLTVGGTTHLLGSILVGTSQGRSIGYAISTPYGTRYLYFTNGILTGFT